MGIADEYIVVISSQYAIATPSVSERQCDSRKPNSSSPPGAAATAQNHFLQMPQVQPNCIDLDQDMQTFAHRPNNGITVTVRWEAGEE